MKTTRIEVNVGVEAPPERVYDALLNPDALRAWFAESADVSIAELRYDFWGRYTPEDPDRSHSRHPIVQLEPRQVLVFEWKLRGADTRVTLSLAEEEGGTQIRLEHDDAPARNVEEGSLADWWGLSLENGKAWVERGRTGLRVDFAIPPELELRLELDIDAPRREVFRALTDREQLERWIGEPGKMVIEPHVGGRIDFGWGDDGGPVRILSFEPDREVSYAWTYAAEPETVVTWSLTEGKRGTRLTLVHQGFVDAILDRPYRTGWTKFLNRVKHMVEAGPSWRAAQTTAHDYEPVR